MFHQLVNSLLRHCQTAKSRNSLDHIYWRKATGDGRLGNYTNSNAVSFASKENSKFQFSRFMDSKNVKIDGGKERKIVSLRDIWI